MAWVRLEDGFVEHPKVIGLSDAAFRLHVRALCYSSRLLTDGTLPRAWVAKSSMTAARQLVGAGLWEDTEAGYRIHDYLEYQPSRLEVEAARAETHASKSRAGRIGGIASGEARRKQIRSNNEADMKQEASTAQEIAEARAWVLVEAGAKQNEAPSPPIPSPEDPIIRSTTTNAVPVSSSSSPLIVSPLRYEKSKESFAFFGSRLRVPHVLHQEFATKLGRYSEQLGAWYLQVNDEVEVSGAPIPDVFAWLRPKFKTWAESLSGDAELARFLSGEV